MTPFYFGDSDKPLFGIYHQPASSQFQDTSIVFCNPIGFEYGRAHSVIRYLAKKLASNGYHVLRFDYYATGDSSGDSQDVTISQCIKNIELACDEIKTMSANRKVTLVGFRIGAALAAIISKNYKISRLVLWDPVIFGESYLNNLQVMHDRMLSDSNRFDLKYLSSTDISNELLGYEFTKALKNEIKAINLSELEKVKTRKIDVICNQDNKCNDSISKEDNFFAKASFHQFISHAEWDNVDKIESKVLPDQSIEKIIEIIG